MYFPQSTKLPKHFQYVIDTFERNDNKISSDIFQLKSDDVLAVVAEDLDRYGYKVERSKKKCDLIRVPVMYGINGSEELSFEVDAYHPEEKTVIEVEAGRGFTNYQFLKDFYESCMMQEVDYFCVAVRNDYKGHKDFESVRHFFSALYACQRMEIPLRGILVIGY